jgi:hypothetical protein
MILRQEAEAFDSRGAELDDAATRVRLAEILKRREFASVSQPGWFQALTARVGRWIVRMLRRIFRPLAGFSHSSQLLVWSLAAILFLVLAFLVVRIFLRTARTAALAIESPASTGRPAAIGRAKRWKPQPGATFAMPFTAATGRA